jgi:hypothetical protein
MSGMKHPGLRNASPIGLAGLGLPAKPPIIPRASLKPIAVLRRDVTSPRRI